MNLIRTAIACMLLSVTSVTAAAAQINFFVPPTFSGAGQIFTGDFNADGKPDILSADGELQLGNGEGSFTGGAALDRQVFAVADFNADGKQDVLEQGTGTLLVRLGNGDGTFQPAISTNSGANLQLVASADLNGDSSADVIGVFNSSLLVYINHGDGTFAAATTYPLGSLSGSVLLTSDFNGDHKTDVAVLTQDTNAPGQVQVFLGNGDGGLQSAKISSGLRYPGSAVAGDFDGDGNQDLVVAWQLGTPASAVSLLRGNNGGTFQSPTQVFANGGYLATADLRGIGKLDLIVEDSPAVEVYLGNGAGSFTNTHSYLNGVDGGLGAATADFNLDGKPDISSGHYVLLANGDGTFQGQPAVPLSENGVDLITTGDFNGDGFPDVVELDRRSGFTNQVNILLNDGTGALAVANSYTVQPTQDVSSAVATDINHDGNLDLVIIGTADDPSLDWIVFVLLGRGDGSFEVPVLYPLGAVPGGGAVVSGDFNEDHVSDVALEQGDGTIAILLSRGDGTFQPPISFYDGFTGGSSLSLADFNGDGHLDLASGGSTFESQETAILLGNGDGTFQNANFSLSTFSASLTGDFNGDGIPDLVGNTESTVQVWLGNGDGTFHSLPAWNSRPTLVLTADLNGDHIPDLVSSNSGTSPNVNIYLGDGAGGFGPPITVPAFVFLHDLGPLVQSADLNQDQKNDLVLSFSSLTRPGVYVLLNATNFVPGVNLAPASVSFPSQIAGTTSDPIPVVLTNTGAVKLGVTGVSIAGVDASQFSQINNCGVVQPAGSCTIQTRFSPTSVGNFAVNLSIADDASGSPQSVPLSGTGTASEDMGLVVPPGASDSQTISAGGTATYTLSIGGTGWAGQVTLTCSGAPTGATCTANPASLDVSASNASQITVQVNTTSQMMATLSPASPEPPSWFWGMSAFGLVVLPIAARGRVRVRLGGALLLLLGLLAGCSGGSSHRGSGTPPGSYTLTLTATSGTLRQSLPLTLTVR